MHFITYTNNQSSKSGLDEQLLSVTKVVIRKCLFSVTSAGNLSYLTMRKDFLVFKYIFYIFWCCKLFWWVKRAIDEDFVREMNVKITNDFYFKKKNKKVYINLYWIIYLIFFQKMLFIFALTVCFVDIFYVSFI